MTGCCSRGPMLDFQHPHSWSQLSNSSSRGSDVLFWPDTYTVHSISVGKTLIKKYTNFKKTKCKKIFPSVLLVSDTTEREVGITCQREAQVRNRCYLSKTGTGLHRKAGTYREWGQECTACGDKGARINALTMSTSFRYENSARKVGMSFALVSSGFLSVSRAVVWLRVTSTGVLGTHMTPQAFLCHTCTWHAVHKGRTSLSLCCNFSF